MSTRRQRKSKLEQFALNSELLKQFAESHGGVFDPRPEISFEELSANQPPFIEHFWEMMFPGAHSDKRSERYNNAQAEIHEKSYPRVSADFTINRFQVCIRLDRTTSLESTPLIQVLSSPKMKSIATLHLWKRNIYSEGDPTCRSMPDIYVPDIFSNRLLPKRVIEWQNTRPVDTYFCPFSNPALQTDYVVRSSKIFFGNAFASDEAISKTIVELLNLCELDVNGLFSEMFGNGCTMSIVAQPGDDIRQFGLLLDLMERTIELAGEHGLLDDQ